MPDELALDPNCDLCEAARITPWFHEDDICWIAECEICAVPMVVWRSHGVTPPSDQLAHMHDKLAMVVVGELHVRALRRRQHAQHPRPLPRARASAGRVLRSRSQAPRQTSEPRRSVTEHVLTIDLGTSGPKVALFTLDGSFVDGDFTPVALNVLPDGGVEQSPGAWWDGVVAAAQRVMGRTAIPAADVDRGRGHVAMVGNRSDRPRRHAAARRDHLDGFARRGGDAARRRRRGAAAGLRTAQAAHVDQSHGWRARAVGQGLDLAHPLVAARAARDRAGDVEVPRAEGLAQLPAHGSVRGDARLDRPALGHRQPRRGPRRLRPRPAAASRSSTARSCPISCRRRRSSGR